MADELPPGFQVDSSPAPQQGAGLPPGFQLDEASSGAGATGDFEGSPPPGFQLDEEKYGTTGQQAIAGIEGVAKGVAGPLATYAEKHLLGQKPEDIEGRAEANPWTHGIGEAVGFGGSLLTGTGEAALLGHAGELAAHAAGLGEAATTGAKLARGAVTAATEMGLFQAGDEASKWILNAPQAPGSVVANIGLSALLGGVTGPAFTGGGLLLKKGLDSAGLKDFVERLAWRKANIDPNEMMRHEAENVVNNYNSMNSEVTGANGLKSQAIAKLVPEMNDKIEGQARGMLTKMEDSLTYMRSKPNQFSERYISKFENDLNNFKASIFESPPAQTGFDFPNEKYAVTRGNTTELMDELPKKYEQRLKNKVSVDKVPVMYEPPKLGTAQWPEPEGTINLPQGGNIKSPQDIFNGIQDLKKSLQDYSKGNWGPFAIQSHHEAYDFLNLTKNLSRDARTALEDTGVWGKAADIQKELNASWVKALPAMKDFEKKFMTKIGDQLEISADKFNTYSKQGLKSTTVTDRQKLLGNFVDAMDNHFKAVDKIYQSAGVENPFPPAGMSMLKESVEKQSLGSRLADVWHDKLSAHAIGSIAGAGIGGTLGGNIGHGLEGAYIGREVLGPVFSGLLKPILEKYPNVDLGAFQQALSVAKAVEKGNNNLVNASKSLFEAGGKTFPSQLIPSAHDLEKLDERTKSDGDDVAHMIGIPGNIGYYLPGHDTAIAKTSGDAISYLNSKRPMPQKAMPLDNAPKVSAVDKAAYDRTLSIAQQPLLAFKHIKSGTLIPQDVETIHTIYPEYYQKMSEQMMMEMTNALHNETFIPYKIRQGMSLFLGQPLDSTMTPTGIMSAQAVFQQQPSPEQGHAGPKKSTSKLSKISDNHMTPNQSAINRQQSDRS